MLPSLGVVVLLQVVAIGYGKINTVANPCTVENLAWGHYYHAYPHNPAMYVQCTEWGTPHLRSCPPDSLWYPTMMVCVDATGMPVEMDTGDEKVPAKPDTTGKDQPNTIKANGHSYGAENGNGEYVDNGGNYEKKDSATTTSKPNDNGHKNGNGGMQGHANGNGNGHMTGHAAMNGNNNGHAGQTANGNGHMTGGAPVNGNGGGHMNGQPAMKRYPFGMMPVYPHMVMNGNRNGNGHMNVNGNGAMMNGGMKEDMGGMKNMMNGMLGNDHSNGNLAGSSDGGSNGNNGNGEGYWAFKKSWNWLGYYPGQPMMNGNNPGEGNGHSNGHATNGQNNQNGNEMSAGTHGNGMINGNGQTRTTFGGGNGHVVNGNGKVNGNGHATTGHSGENRNGHSSNGKGSGRSKNASKGNGKGSNKTNRNAEESGSAANGKSSGSQIHKGFNPCVGTKVRNHPLPGSPTKYLECQGWYEPPKIKSCTYGQVWVQEHQKCVQVVPATTTMAPPEIDPEMCAEAPGYYLPHPSDITKYIQCDQYGNIYLRTCGDNKIWDEFYYACVGRNEVNADGEEGASPENNAAAEAEPETTAEDTEEDGLTPEGEPEPETENDAEAENNSADMSQAEADAGEEENGKSIDHHVHYPYKSLYKWPFWW